MSHVVWGTAGHIDHGKTSLIQALTGTDCDRLPEERERGITIDLGFAQLSDDDLQLHFVDVPGHERLVHTMIAGASGIDLALLVVAAGATLIATGCQDSGVAWTEMTPGLSYADSVAGQGPAVTGDEFVVVHYTGWLWVEGKKGEEFGTSDDAMKLLEGLGYVGD